MGDIIEGNFLTRLDCDPDKVVNSAVGKLDGVVIIGFDKEGNEYFASSIADGGDVLWYIERAKKKLLEVPDDMCT